LRLFEIRDEGLVERLRTARFHQLLRRSRHQHAARIHQSNAVATASLIHEMGRDEDGDAAIPRKIDQQPPE